MRVPFLWTISIAILLSIIQIRKFAKSIEIPNIAWLRRVLIAAVTAEFANLFIAVSTSSLEAELSYSLYYASLDWAIFFLMLFIRSYIRQQDTLFKKVQVYIYLGLTILDTIQLMANAFYHHVFTVEQQRWITGEWFYMPSHRTSYTVHLILDYVAIATIFLILIRESIKAVSFYRRKYLAVIGVIGLIVVLNGVYMLLRLPTDWSVLLYSVAAFLLGYFTSEFTPKMLKSSAISQTLYKLGEGIILFDIYDECIYANKAAELMFGIDARTLTVDDEPIREWLRGRSLKEAYPIDTFYDIDSNRTLLRYRLQLRQIESAKGQYLGSYFQIEDVTKDYRSMMELRESRRKEEKARIEASRANRAKSDFLANMSHEIRTPINAVLGMNEMILREDISPEVRELAQNIANSGEALLSIVNDILDFSKIESGKMELNLAEYEPFGIIRSCETMIAPRAAAKDLAFSIECDEKCPKVLFGDETRIRQIIINILTNACKYTEKGSISLKLSWESKRSKDGNLIIAVTDTGMGIAKENQGKLFDAFQRIEERKNRNIEGTGLGLSITNQLVRLMNGAIYVDSEVGKGSTFTVNIPQGVLSEELSGAYGLVNVEKDSKYQELFKAPEAKILAVDDYKMNLTVLKGLLKKTEVKLTLANSGQEALDKIKTETFDLVLMDHMMPGMDGIEALERIRKSDTPNRDIPVIMLTANAIAGVEEQYLKAGFQGYLSKPINSKALEETLLKYLPPELIVK